MSASIEKFSFSVNVSSFLSVMKQIFSIKIHDCICELMILLNVHQLVCLMYVQYFFTLFFPFAKVFYSQIFPLP